MLTQISNKSVAEKKFQNKGKQIHLKIESLLEKIKYKIIPNEMTKLSNIDLESTKKVL